MNSALKVLGGVLLCAGTALGLNNATAQSVRFDQPRYDIEPGQIFPVQILIEPAPPAGLSSFGLKLMFNPTNASVSNLNAVTVPPPLNFNGVAGSGAVKAVGAGFAGAKGTVNFSVPVQQAYTGQVLSTFLVTDKASGSHTLRLDFFNTLGATEQIFVDGSGTVLNSSVTFGTTLVNYRPVVQITSPASGATFLFRSVIPLVAEAQDLDGAIACVKFCEGTNIFAQKTNAPFVFAWTDAAVGTHVVKAIAYDNFGASSTSSNVTIIVQSNSPPVLAAIGNKAVVTGTAVSFTATATDPDAPLQVLKFSIVSGSGVGAAITSDGQFTWTPSSSGTNSFTIRVTDNGVPALSDSKSFLIVVTESGFGSYAIFAGRPGTHGSRVLEVKGERNVVVGRIHSNESIEIEGDEHIFRDATVEYVTTIDPKPAKLDKKVTLQNSRLVVSTVKPYPVNYDISEFAPGGSSALAAQAVGKYFHVKKNTDLDDFVVNHTLKEGLYYVEGKIEIKENVRGGKVTLVATDEIDVKAKRATFEAYTRCLLAFSTKSTGDYDHEAIEFYGDGSRLQGVMFAPNAAIEISADDSVLQCSLIGRGVEVDGENIQITGIDSAICTPLVPPLYTTIQGQQLKVSFQTAAGLSYAVECSDSLTDTKWQQVSLILGDGSVKSLMSSQVGPQRFYRLRLRQP